MKPVYIRPGSRESARTLCLLGKIALALLAAYILGSMIASTIEFVGNTIILLRSR